VVHREHAVVETADVRTAKSMGLRGLPSKTSSTNIPATREESHPGAVGAGAHPGTPGMMRTARTGGKRICGQKTDASTISNRTPGCLND
jgi:hypothetical protein